MIRAAEQLAPKVGLVGACRALGVARASVYRARKPSRCGPRGERRSSPRALSQNERAAVLDILHEDRFSDRAPAAVYAALLEEGRYVCSVRTMYRLLHDAQEVRERRDQRRHPRLEPPRLMANAPNQVWTWDITRLPGPRKWVTYPLYVVLDLFSRYVVAWDGRRKGERHKRQAPDCQRMPKAGHSTRTTDAPPGPRRTDDSQDVFAVADGSRHPGQLQQTPRFR